MTRSTYQVVKASTWYSLGGVGTGHVGRAADAELGARAEDAVLLVGLAPHVGQVVDVVVDALLGVLVHQPGRAHQGPVGRRAAAR